MPFETVFKELYNKNHGKGGRFTSKSGGGGTGRAALLSKLEGEYLKPGPVTEKMANDFAAAKDTGMKDVAKGKFGQAAEMFNALGEAQEAHGMQGRSNFKLASRFEGYEEKVKSDVKKKRFEDAAEARHHYVTQIMQDTDFMEAYGNYFEDVDTDMSLTGFVFTELSELEHISIIDGMAAGSFTTMLGQKVSFPKADLKKYVENTKRVLESTKDSVGNIVGLPIDMKGHDHMGGAGWIVGLELDEARNIIRFIVNWTGEGIRVVKENLSRFFSPSIDDKNKVILGGSLTNWPATRNDKGEILLRPVELSLSMKELNMSDTNNMSDVLEAIKNLPNTIRELMSRKDEGDGNGGGEPQGLSDKEKEELKKAYVAELSRQNMSVQDLLQTPEAIEELGRKAQELAQQAIKAEARKMRAVEFAAEICGGTSEKPFGLPIPARDVVALLLSLPEAQANAVEKVLRQTHLNAIDFAQHGFDKMGFPMKPKLPEPIHSVAVNWVASGHTIEEFMKLNAAELGNPLDYDLTEFESRKKEK